MDNGRDDRKLTHSEATPGLSTAALIFAIVLISAFFGVCGWLIYMVRGGEAGYIYEKGKDAATGVHENGKETVTPSDQPSSK